MQLGFYISGVAGSKIEQQFNILSNDIANATTTGYRADRTSFSTYFSHKLGLASGPEQLPAAYLNSGRQYVDMTPAGYRMTGNPLDIALHGNAYLRVRQANGSEAYTRAGDLQLDASGNLLTADGKPILDDSGQPITLPPGTPSISADGSISIHGHGVGRLGIAAITDPKLVSKMGGTLLVTPASNVTTASENIRVVQGSLEDSNVNPVLAMTEMMGALRDYQSMLKVLNQYDKQMTTLSQQVGRVTNN